jgi:hypothetical protein
MWITITLINELDTFNKVPSMGFPVSTSTAVTLKFVLDFLTNEKLAKHSPLEACKYSFNSLYSLVLAIIK